jgi:hypothetical protein
MLVDYYVTGGKIVIQKTEFAKEMLRKDSVLRILLGYTTGRLPGENAPSIERNENGTVTIDYHKVPEIKLNDEPQVLVNSLKQRYGEEISGKLTIRSVYTTFQQLYYFTIDLG